MITIFKSGDVEYPENLNKPVRYDVDFLKDIASKTSSVDITQEHSDEVIGVLNNFVVEDGCLKSEKPDGLDLKGMGFSPVFDFELYEHEDFFTPRNGKMINIGFTKTPRSQIVYNSIEPLKEEGNMDDTLRKVLQEKDDLVKKIGVLEKEKNSYQKMVDARDEEIDKIKQSYSDIDDKLKEVEDLREKAKLYDSLQESRKNELIKELAGDNDDLADNYSSFTYEQLKFLNENKTPNNPGHGIKPPVARGLDLNGESVPSNDEYTDEMFKEDYLALFGEKI